MKEREINWHSIVYILARNVTWHITDKNKQKHTTQYCRHVVVCWGWIKKKDFGSAWDGVCGVWHVGSSLRISSLLSMWRCLLSTRILCCDFSLLFHAFCNNAFTSKISNNNDSVARHVSKRFRLSLLCLWNWVWRRTLGLRWVGGREREREREWERRNEITGWWNDVVSSYPFFQ